jgi:hypothetical protein
MYNNLNINEFKYALSGGIASCLLCNYIITSNGKDIYV